MKSLTPRRFSVECTNGNDAVDGCAWPNGAKGTICRTLLVPCAAILSLDSTLEEFIGISDKVIDRILLDTHTLVAHLLESSDVLDNRVDYFFHCAEKVTIQRGGERASGGKVIWHVGSVGNEKRARVILIRIVEACIFAANHIIRRPPSTAIASSPHNNVVVSMDTVFINQASLVGFLDALERSELHECLSSTNPAPLPSS